MPLDIDELAVHASLNEIRKTDPRALHEMILDDPVAACECFHTTVRMTLQYLFNSTGHIFKDADSFALPLDDFATQLNPGFAGYLSWHMGVTEPQLRKSLHVHALTGLLGCRDLEELLLRADLARAFVQIWQYVASVYFRSPEAFAAHCGSDEAMTAFASEPLIPLKEAQKEVLSGDYA